MMLRLMPVAAVLLLGAAPPSGVHVVWRTTIETTRGATTKREVTEERSWRQDGRLRIERAGDTLVTEVVTLVEADGGVTLVDLPSKSFGARAAPPDARVYGALNRFTAALAYGLRLDADGGLQLPALPFSVVDAGRYLAQSDAGASLELELGTQSFLDARAFADEAAKLLRPQHEVEAKFIDALAALPAHPKRLLARHVLGTKTLTIATELVKAESGPFPKATFAPPPGFRRVADIQRVVFERNRLRLEQERARRRREAGLERPFRPTPTSPLPPPLPGGSCRTASFCFEALDLQGLCDDERRSDEPCPRADVYGVCETSQRELRYYYSVGSLEHGFPALERAHCEAGYFGIAEREADALDAGLARLAGQAPRSRWSDASRCLEVYAAQAEGVDGGCPDGWLGTCVESEPARVARFYGPDQARAQRRALWCSSGLWFDGPGGFDAGAPPPEPRPGRRR